MVRFLAITIPNSPNPIAPTVVSLARDVAARFCEDFEDSIATALAARAETDWSDLALPVVLSRVMRR